ncbi:MAG: hypothetical protein PUC16_00915 [Bacteroidales bacterium]|nr:hypothetical protein [Bacteroidales bacterium]MCI7465264.1 hypothetical protein [Bacteroidales bacterium]MCI7661193.1 hypothetical protein [Bacteroidales bacterium]MDD5960825.1 hypothetical protein [Bacteroidales bacterium]MDY3977784.1 hypothetical protein [Candidatus Onthomorpha sp.]
MISIDLTIIGGKYECRYKKRLIDLRARLASERERKKSDNARYANLIKGASSTSSKLVIAKAKLIRQLAMTEKLND